MTLQERYDAFQSMLSLDTYLNFFQSIPVSLDWRGDGALRRRHPAEGLPATQMEFRFMRPVLSLFMLTVKFLYKKDWEIVYCIAKDAVSAEELIKHRFPAAVIQKCGCVLETDFEFAPITGA